jgi:thiol-disulfide isomerase/thioredoxin
MKKTALLCLFLTILFCEFKLAAQQKFTFQVSVPKGLNRANLSIEVYDGVRRVNTKLEPFGEINVKGTRYGTYACIELRYKGDSMYKAFAKLFFTRNETAEVSCTYSSGQVQFRTVNTLTDEELGLNAFTAFTKVQQDEFVNFLNENKTKLAGNDSLLKIAFSNSDKLFQKRFEFIKLYPNYYYSFHVFATEIINSENIPTDTLLNMYYRLFNDSIKNTHQGANITSVLASKVKRKNLAIAPDFNATDIYGKKVSLASLRGKPVLLQFWASWCIPCVGEIPYLRDIRKMYKPNKLEIISISIDSDSSAFKKAIEKYQMNWTNILGADDILVRYGSISSVPQLYLIDDRGKIVFSHTKGFVGRNDSQLIRLKQLLAKLQ